MEYPLEWVIEVLAPTTELDFDRLPPEKQEIYREIQAARIHGSPDGPWFFIIARNDPSHKRFQLIGITDTAMLRPQVFALSQGEVQVGLICSEKQAIDATLHSLSSEDSRFHRIADKYWNARGGSHTDGGAFIFNVMESGNVKAGKFSPVPTSLERRSPSLLSKKSGTTSPGLFMRKPGQLSEKRWKKVSAQAMAFFPFNLPRSASLSGIMRPFRNSV